jgi:Zinc finger, C2H2 type/C2H2-type zinc finger
MRFLRGLECFYLHISPKSKNKREIFFNKMSDLVSVKEETEIEVIVNNESLFLNNIKQEAEVQFELILPEHKINENISPEPVAKDEAGDKHKCDNCEEIFEFQSDLLLHKISHSIKTKSDLKSSDPDVKETEKTNFKCSFCFKKFKTKKDLAKHVWAHKNKKRYHCKHCTRSFTKRIPFEEHSLIHSTNDSRPFKCDICPKDYCTKTVLKEHILLTHSTHRIFSCDQCNYKTQTNSSLYQHKRAHQKLFSCSQCDRTFSTNYLLTEHTRKHQNLNEHSCSFCERSFSTRQNLRDHIRYIHGEIFKI